MQVVVRCADAHRNAGWCVRLVDLVARVDPYFADADLPLELDVDQMGLRPVRLPECLRAAVPQLLDAIAWLRGR
eukprot:CAMPEP_0117463446 /NCGR_PEP_ID=MMETSP0784-20121206/3580_1 /TAXON_ID=39447 /ORGANISM="" /LENGTH=73 /DNA_ID=CAMNT_0005257255 /DNA_START=315 /DNA_END=539 /DNA_ORIENTATION=+